jgi:allophanate hydrolase subunit 2
MVHGAIEIPPSGDPIVLGPDHPTTGGYPIAGVVIRADLGRLFARRPGARVVFAPISVDEARRLWAELRPALRS